MCQASPKARIVTLLLEHTGRDDTAAFHPAARLGEDLNLDSLDMAELCLALEETFAIEISLGREAQLKTVGDIFNLVEELHG